MDEPKKQMEVGQEMNAMIEKAKDQICQEMNISRERLEELKSLGQECMTPIKEIMKKIDNPVERGFVLKIVGDKCLLASDINFADAEESKDDKCDEPGQDIPVP